MTSRDLITLHGGEDVVGSVTVNGDTAKFAGLAGGVFAVRRSLEGDLPVGQDLIANGWSNGQTLYLGPVKP